MRKFLLLCCALCVGISVASAQNAKTSADGFIDVITHSASSEGYQLQFFDTKGYVSDQPIYRPEDKYLLNKVTLTVSAPDKKPIKYKCGNGCALDLAKDFAGQTIKLKVSRKGYKTLKTTCDMPQPKKFEYPHPITKEVISNDVYNNFYVFLASKGGKLPEPEIDAIKLDIKLSNDGNHQVTTTN